MMELRLWREPAPEGERAAPNQLIHMHLTGLGARECSGGDTAGGSLAPAPRGGLERQGWQGCARSSRPSRLSKSLLVLS